MVLAVSTVFPLKSTAPNGFSVKKKNEDPKPGPRTQVTAPRLPSSRGVTPALVNALFRAEARVARRLPAFFVALVAIVGDLRRMHAGERMSSSTDFFTFSPSSSRRRTALSPPGIFYRTGENPTMPAPPARPDQPPPLRIRGHALSFGLSQWGDVAD